MKAKYEIIGSIYILGNGETYAGTANKGESGVTCQVWKNSRFKSQIFDDQDVSKIKIMVYLI